MKKNELLSALRSLQNNKNRTALAVTVGVMAMLLLLLSELLPSGNTQKTAASTVRTAAVSQYQTQLEQQLEELISQLQGAGRTTVMVTLTTGEETIYAVDTQTGDLQQQETHVLLQDGSALAETTYLPQVCGVAVLCEGGGDVRVAARITELLHSLLDLPANRICVEQRKCFDRAPKLFTQKQRRKRFMRALSRNTRRVTALTLAAALVIAVYLNWQYARADITPQTEDDTLMVSAEPVEAEAETAITDALPTEAEAASGVNKNYGEAQLVSVANDSGTRFFEQARLKREKAHDEAMDTLQKSLKSSSLTAEEKKEYTAQMAAGLEDLNVENEIETLVRAKGFADCLCFLQAGRADLTVMTAGEPLTAAQVAQIRDVVMNKSSVTAQNITVVEVK